jgi:hypothetical protein
MRCVRNGGEHGLAGWQAAFVERWVAEMKYDSDDEMFEFDDL